MGNKETESNNTRKDNKMKSTEAKEYVELILEQLVYDGILPEEKYGRMTVEQVEKLAELVAAKSEE